MKFHWSKAIKGISIGNVLLSTCPYRKGYIFYASIAGKDFRFHYSPDSVWYFLSFLKIWPAWYAISSRDCDHTWSYHAEFFPFGVPQARRYHNRLLDRAEGPVHFRRITRKDYREFKAYTWDQAAELAGY